MFQTGDLIVYGNSGICRVERIDVPDFQTFERGKQYYFLRCDEDGSRIYAPVDSRIPMRALLSPQEALQLLQQLPALPVQQPASRDHKLITQHYNKLLQQHTAQALACVIKSIHCRSNSTDGSGGRMTSAESAVLKKAESQLCSELAAALMISPSAARDKLLAALRAK